MENSLELKKPELLTEWNYSINDISPNEISYKASKKVWWTCSVCKKDYNMSPNHRTSGSSCPYCSGSRATDENSFAGIYPQYLKYWDYDKNFLKPNTFTPKSNKKVWWIGDCGHSWEKQIKLSVNANMKCPYCSSRKILLGYNDMWTTNPKLASLLLNPEDGYSYMEKSNKSVDWKCDSCQYTIENKRISDTNIYGLSCPRCSDGKSYPEKFFANLLSSLEIPFKAEYRDTWTEDKVYDFFFSVDGEKFIVETHGGQHYNGGFKTRGGKSIKQEKINDDYKKSLALNNKIDSYIILDCRNSNVEWIRNSIENSELNNVLNLDKVDWDSVGKHSSSSLVVKAYELHKSGIINRSAIGRIIGVSSGTVKTYLMKMGVKFE